MHQTSVKAVWILALGFLAASASTAQAKEVTLAEVTTDLIKDKNGNELPAYIRMIVDEDGEVTHFKYDGTSPKTGEPSSYTWPVAQLAKGLVPIDPASTFGKKAVILKSTQFQPSNGGPVTLNYLSSPGPFGDRRGELRLDVDRAGPEWILWIDDKEGRRPVNSMRFISRKLAGKPVGIQQVVVK